MFNTRKVVLGVLLLVMLLIAGCAGGDGENQNGQNRDADSSTQVEQTVAKTPQVQQEQAGEPEQTLKKIDKLTIGFVPSRDPDEIVTTTEPLKDLLTQELATFGYDVQSVDIIVGTNYEAVGEGLSAGTIDIGLIPGGTYVLYDDGAEVILTATRAGLNHDSDDARDWNANKPTEATDKQAIYYRALIVAGPSAKGRELADKVNSGEELTFEDLNSATWAVMSSSSSAGYIYPTLWMMERFDKQIRDLSNVVQVDSYGNGFARLAAEQIDVFVFYADARRDNADRWTADYGRSASIWDETDVIGVTPGIYNDTISVSKNSDIVDEAMKTALQEAFINIAQTEAGKGVISIYNHEGYQKAVPSDYDHEREAQRILREMNG